MYTHVCVSMLVILYPGLGSPINIYVCILDKPTGTE